jgi:hypothetical protein
VDHLDLLTSPRPPSPHGGPESPERSRADVRSAKIFEDAERIADLLDLETQGGLHDAVAEILAALPKKVSKK